MKKVLVIGSLDYASFLNEVEYVASKFRGNLSEIDNTDILLFTGGEDVSPSLYSQEAHFLTHANMRRDEEESAIYQHALNKKKFMLGICRGAQFLTVMNRGKLVQHVNNHAVSSGHMIRTSDGREFNVTSTHHQMMYPYGVSGHVILAAALPSLSDIYFKNNHQFYEMMNEPEIVWYPRTKSLGVQPHPEMMGKQDKFVIWLNEKITELYSLSLSAKNSTELEAICEEFDSLIRLELGEDLLVPVRGRRPGIRIQAVPRFLVPPMVEPFDEGAEEAPVAFNPNVQEIIPGEAHGMQFIEVGRIPRLGGLDA